MEFTGKVTELLPLKSGTTSNGQWRRQEFIMSFVEGQYTKNLCVQLWGPKIDMYPIQVGMTIRAKVNIESKRGSQGVWFTNITAYAIEIPANPEASGPVTNVSGFNPPRQPVNTAHDSWAKPETKTEGLPF